MQETSALYKQLIQSTTHWFEISLVIGDSGLLLDDKGNTLVFGADRILIDTGGADGGFDETYLISLQTTSKIFEDENPQVGCAIASEIDVEMLAPLAEIPKKARVVPYVRVTDGTQYSEWLQKGVYFIDTRETNIGVGGEEVLKFHGYDSMVETDVEFPGISSHDFPCSDVQLIRDIAAYLGVTVDERTWEIMTANYQIGLPLGYSIREVLQQLAGAYCGSFIFNDYGELRLVQINGMPPESNLLIDEAGYTIVFGLTPNEEVRILV